MRYLKLESREAASYFAAEDLIMEDSSCTEPVFMLWQTEPTVMLGCNQVVRAEVDAQSAKKSNVRLVRRQSGGGTIFTDPGAFQFTVITPFRQGIDDSRALERRYLAEPVVAALSKLGVEAAASGRNDILAEGRKISGLAQRASRTKLCSHGSLLYDTNMDVLSSVLRPDEGKLLSKGIRSVKSRVLNVRELLKARGTDLSTEAFGALFLRQFAESLGGLEELVLSEQQKERIQEIRRTKYASDEWTFGRDPAFSLCLSHRFPMGKLQLCYEVAGGKILSLNIRGDFLSTRPVDELESGLKGVPFHANTIRQKLSEFPLNEYLGGITADEFVECMMAG